MAARRIRPASLEQRWAALPAGSRAVLAAAILHDGELTDACLASLAPQPAAVDVLVSERWLHETRSGRWLLAPGLDRAALRECIPWSERRAAHEALGQLLQRTPAQWSRAAGHLEAAGRLATAGELWLAAARHHCSRHQHNVAGRCFAEAIRLLPPHTPEAALVEAVRDFGTCAGLQRDSRQALELITRWREQAAWHDRPLFQAEAARVHATLLERTARHIEAARLRREAAENFQRAGRPAEEAAELIAATNALTYGLHLTLARDSATRALAAAVAAAMPALQSQAHTLLGITLGSLGETADGKRHLETALAIALREGLTTDAANTYRLLGTVEEYASCYGDEQGAFNRALSYCRRHHQDYIAAMCLGCYSYSLFRSGNWKRSFALARQVYGNRRGPESSRCVAAGVLGLLHAHRGEVKPALRCLEWCIQASRRTGVACMELFAWWGLAVAHEFAGDSAQAAADYRHLMDFWRTTEDRHDAVPGFTCAVLFFAREGDLVQAAEFAGALQKMAAINPNPEIAGAAALAAAELKLRDGDATEALRAIREALKLYEQRDLTVEALRAQICLGRALHAAGDRAEAGRVLAEARRQSARLGCRPYAAHAAEMAGQILAPDAAGAVAAPSSWDTLTPRQRDVARHLSAGRTNKEIATALGLSVRTIDMHVAHLFARLDCRTRAEAATRLAALLA